MGPTASGKSALAFEVARRTGAEIVSADAMAVYRGMDIGTATPGAAERAAVAHHLVDVVEPEEEFTVVEYQARARVALADLAHRGVPAVVVGGTGLYVRAVVDDLAFPGRYPDVAAELAREGDTAALHRRLRDADPEAAARMEPTNRRRVLRALEVTVGSGRPFSSFGPGLGTYPPRPHLQIGPSWDRTCLDRRIEDRYGAQMAEGFLDEVRTLVGRRLSRTAAQALGYRELLDHLADRCSLDEALDAARRQTRRFARRQERWFRRDPRIVWLAGPVDVDGVIDRWRRC